MDDDAVVVETPLSRVSNTAGISQLDIAVVHYVSVVRGLVSRNN